MLGHSSITITADAYAHLLEGVAGRLRRPRTRSFREGVTNR
jgi:hypothetical protein